MGTEGSPPVTKEVINLALAGTLEAPTDLPPLATVTFTATATVGGVKLKFRREGTTEATVLVIDPESFEIQRVTERPPDPQLPLTNGEPVAELAPEFDGDEEDS